MKFIKYINVFSYKNLYWIYIVLIGLVFVFLVPPFQKPDSEFHYYNSYGVVNKSCVFTSSGGYMNIPKDVYEFPVKLQAEKIAHFYQIKFPKSLLKEKYVSSSNEMVVFNRSCVKFGLLSYLPSVIGLKIGGSNLLLGFYLARFFDFIFFLIALIVSLKIVGRYSPLVIAFSIIPMVIHQVSAISYDSIHISLGLLSFSLYVYIKNNFNKVRLCLLFLFYVLLLIFSLSKGGYYLVLVLPILLPSYPFFKKNPRNIIIKYLILFLYYLLAFIFIKSSVGYVDNLRTGVFNANLQREVILGDPFYYAKVLFETTSKYFYFYWISFVANFGALDYQAHFSVSLLITILVVYIISRFKFNKTKIPKNTINDILEVLFSFGIAVGSYIFILTSMYLIWTPIAAKTIEGPQGRYFFIPFLFFIYGVIRFIEVVGLRKSKYILGIFIFVIVTANIIKSIYLRYYDYSGVYSNINELSFDEYRDYKSNNLIFRTIPVVDSMMCENIGDNKVGGFAVYFTNNIKENENLGSVFKYEILSGNKILHSGYLDQTKIQVEGEYLEEFKKILYDKKGNDICLRIYKKFTQGNSDLDLYLVEKDGIGVKFLRISK